MKKIFALALLALVITSCSSDDDDNNAYNPVAGDWVYKDPLLNYSEIASFSKKLYASIHVNNNGTQFTYNRGTYTIDKDFIYYPTYTHQYKIVADTLWIKSETINMKYIRK